MAFLGRAKKVDLLCLAEELGETVAKDMKVVELRNLILKCTEYEEVFVKELLERIVKEREEEILRQEKAEEILRKEKEEIRRHEEEMKRQENEFLLEKLKVEASMLNNGNRREKGSQNEGMQEQAQVGLQKLMRKFDPKEGDISFFLILFERQARRVQIKEEDWVTNLVGLLPLEMANLIAREPEEKANDYEHVKNILLKRFKLSPEAFKIKFKRHCKSAENTWRDFGFELANYFNEWIMGLKINDFESLKQLVIVEQMKEQVSRDIQQHFIDDWSKIVAVDTLSEKLDEYENARQYNQGNKASSFQPQRNGYQEKPNTFNNRNHGFGEGNRQGFDNRRGFDKRNSFQKPITCFHCGRYGHLARFCRDKKEGRERVEAKVSEVKVAEAKVSEVKVVEEKEVESKVVTAKFNGEVVIENKKGDAVKPKMSDLKIVKISYGGAEYDAVVDSGAQISVFKSSIVGKEVDYKGYIMLQPAFGDCLKAELKEVEIGLLTNSFITPVIKTVVATLDGLNADILLDTETYEALLEQEKIYNPSFTAAMKLRSDTLKEMLDVNENSESEERETTMREDASKEEETKTENFKKEQLTCDTLQEAWKLAKKKKGGYVIEDSILYHEELVCGNRIRQLVIPEIRRCKILDIAHESVFGAHLGARKTIQRIKYSFYWPGMIKEIKAYCSSCHGCQCRKVIRSVDKIPITPVSRPELPFQVVNVDLIGPIDPVSSQGHKYILCLMDQHSRWPEAVPLKSLTAKSTCEALLEIFSRTGVPEVIVMDNATNFTASLTQEFLKILGACPRFTTPYHPEGNGLIERWNQTLKNMLHHIIREEGRSWYRHIPFLLWAYREVPNATTGVPPFLLMYGREPKGPLSILKSVWTGDILLPLNMKGSVENYLKELRKRLEVATEKAKLTSGVQQGNYAKYYNSRRKYREFVPGDQVLVLVPDSTNKLYARWIGPVKVVRRVKPNSYYLQMPEGNLRLLHVNKIREYRARIQTVGIVYDIDEEFGEIYETPTFPIERKDLEIMERVNLDYLPTRQQNQLKDLLHRYETLFSGTIKRAKVGEHVIKLKSEEETMKPKTYKIPENLKRKVDAQIDELLELGLIEPVVSEIAHPVVCVHKKDGTIRLCIDFRSLNALTVPDAYPMQNMMELNFLVGKKKFITVLDMLKGYWAIPMEESSKHLTAFRTHRGQYQWNVLPFGLKNSAATYQRAMSTVVQPMSDFACAYIDDLAIFSDTWEEHLNHVEEAFKRLENFNFSVNLEKCDFARQKVKYLGHIIGSGMHSPDKERIKAVENLEVPKTKKQLRSALGLCNFYRQYIPNFAKLALPLTELTKKKIPNDIPWNKEAEKAFKELKAALCEITELQVPDIEKPYYLHTDASQLAVGCCLGQLDAEGNIHPIAFGSQKLNPTQQKWSTIEREAYAIIWALKRFETLLCGAKIFLLTDHNPLVFLTSAAPQCPRLQRWALAIQRHDIEASHVKGSKLTNADALSRL